MQAMIAIVLTHECFLSLFHNQRLLLQLPFYWTLCRSVHSSRRVGRMKFCCDWLLSFPSCCAPSNHFTPFTPQGTILKEVVGEMLVSRAFAFSGTCIGIIRIINSQVLKRSVVVVVCLLLLASRTLNSNIWFDFLRSSTSALLAKL